MKNLEKEIVIPIEALEYIENTGGPDQFNFEVIESFFEWFFSRPVEEQCEILKSFYIWHKESFIACFFSKKDRSL